MKRILTILGSILVLLLLGLLIFAFFFHTQIESQIAKQVTERSEGKLSFSDTDLSLFNSFPNLSCRLTDINIQSLAKAEHLDVNIGLLSAIMRKPVIQNATLRNATIELIKDDKGWNYHNLFETKENSASKNLRLELKDTYLENITVKMIDNGKLWSVGHIKEAQMDVSMDKGITDLYLNGAIQVAAKVIDSTAYHQVQLNLKHTMTSSTNYAEIKDSYIDGAIQLEGTYDLSPSGSDTHMDITLNDLEVEDISMYIPIQYRENITNSDFSGSANGALLFSSKILSTENLEIEINDEKLLCQGKYDVTQNQLSDVNLKGRLNSSALTILLPDSLHVNSRGIININKAQISKWNLNEPKKRPHILADCTFDDFAVSFLDSEWLEAGRGDIILDGSRMGLNNVVLGLGQSSLLVHGSMDIRSGKEIELAIKSKYIDVAEIWKTAKAAGLISESGQKTSKPVFDLEGKITAEIDKLIFENANIEDIEGSVDLSYETIDFEAKGDAFSGSIEMGGTADLFEGLHMETDIITKGVQLERCLIECKNFGQEFITSDNMKGEINSVGTYNFYWDDSFNYLKENTKVLLSAKVTEGELNNLEMMKKFSAFIKTKDLERIKFSSLQNYIEIDGENLYIPTMFIQSNATNLTMNGIHSVDHQILYNLEVNAGQVLMNKLKRHDPDLKPQPAQKGWFNLYYRISGRLDDFKYERNKRLVQASFERELLRKEKIYQRLLDRFGYLEELKPPSDWSSIPEYNLN